ncbi:PEP-CTERM sorting domain-containing protein [Duganella sp. BJB475]|nr:PEP-CTERM sorting domain-containing protein [Duganella sp. BJB475]RFP35998.1 PEP-CTERM sorting domain-containing protein [Duganella sp. BJB476]
MFSCAASADDNVAYLADVSTYGPGIGDSAGAVWGGGMARLDSVTDGAFNPIGQQWNFDSVYWSGTGSGVVITLAHAALVNQLVLEADSNDDYHIEFLDRDHVWQGLTAVDMDDNPAGQNLYGGPLAAPVVARAFRISASGDNHYSLAEFQAIGAWATDDEPVVLPVTPADPPPLPVPEPASYLMLVAGLALLAKKINSSASNPAARRSPSACR